LLLVPVITKIMWENMENQRPAAWRVVFKGLSLLEHLVKNGSERCVDDARNHSHTLRSLHQFNYYEGTIDRGLGVREKSKQIVEILGDDERIREERIKAKKLREKFGGSLGGVSGGGGNKYGGYGNDSAGWSGGGGGGGGAGGYGDSGIDSNPSGGGGYGGDSGGYSGRYADDAPASTASPSVTPTFASLPEERTKKPKTKKVKKKKTPVDEGAPAPAAPPAAAAPGTSCSLCACLRTK
jgi:epsin